mmetsp:Transcript_8195/g.17524  ORF Transcript_8195/g.17524 Transcript_8195/m.17524 type:complete len:87 (-) Transcript_8195:200-460(-)
MDNHISPTSYGVDSATALMVITVDRRKVDDRRHQPRHPPALDKVSCSDSTCSDSTSSDNVKSLSSSSSSFWLDLLAILGSTPGLHR